jgi:hypothetical protein
MRDEDWKGAAIFLAIFLVISITFGALMIQAQKTENALLQSQLEKCMRR